MPGQTISSVSTKISTKERLQIDRQRMPEQDAIERRRNFNEVNLGFPEQLAMLEAQRCLQCKEAKCIAGCPVFVDIPRFIQFVAEGNLAAAAQSLLNDNALPAVTGTGQVWQFRDGSPSAGGGYYLVENRQQSGFDSALPGSGLLLWHIDESRSGNDSEWYPGCTNCSSHYKVALVQADNSFNLEHQANRGDGGDPFPGTSENRAVSHLSTPATLLYSGVPAGFALAAISDSSALMTVDITLADGVPPVTTITAAPPALSATTSADFSFTAGEMTTFMATIPPD